MNRIDVKAKIEAAVRLNHYDLASIFLFAFHTFFIIFNWKFQLRGNILDTLYHLLIGKMYLEYGLVDWDVYQFAPLGRPQLYPPLYHILISILRTFTGNYLNCARLLSAIQWLGGLGSTWFFMRKMFSQSTAFYSIILLSNIEAFWFWQGGATPTSLAVIIFPVVLYSFWTKKIITSIILTSFLYWLHLGYPFIILISFIIYSIWNRAYFYTLLKIFIPSQFSFLPWITRLYIYREWIQKIHLTIPFWVSLLPQNLFILLLIFTTLMSKKWRNDRRIQLIISCLIGFLPIFFTYGGYRFTPLASIPMIMICAFGLDHMIKKITRSSLKSTFILMLLFFFSIFEITLTTAETQPGVRGSNIKLDMTYVPIMREFFGSIGNFYHRLKVWGSYSFSEHDELIQWILKNTYSDEIIHVSDTKLALYISLQTGRRIDNGMYREVSSREMYDKMEASWNRGGVYIFHSDETWIVPIGQKTEQNKFGDIILIVTIKKD